MLVSSSSGRLFSVRAPQSYSAGARAETTAIEQASNSSYDHVALSPGPVGERRFQMELVSHLSQEVRTVPTTKELQALRYQVENGGYHPDPMETAARILLMKGADT